MRAKKAGDLGVSADRSATKQHGGEVAVASAAAVADLRLEHESTFSYRTFGEQRTASGMSRNGFSRGFGNVRQLLLPPSDY